MQDDAQHANWSRPTYFTLKQAHRVKERWWGSRADRYQPFWAERCLTIQFSFARPWLRITAGYRLRTVDLFGSHIAIVGNSWSAAKLLAVVLADIKSFPVWKERSGKHQDPSVAQLDDYIFP